MSYSDNIVYFDAQCVLCGNLIQLLFKIDRKNLLRFASLQSAYSHARIPKDFIDQSNYKSVVFQQKDKLYYYSDAVIRIFKTIGFPWNVFQVFYGIPEKWRNHLYNTVAANRYSWFGKSEKCLIPSPELRKKFVHPIII